MNGHEFELFTADLFRKMGYTVKLTKQTGDQGIDVIAVKNRTSLGVQGKCYSNSVSNKAIQEVAAGIKY
ncbi:restriction endonuclease [Cytobacillus praedii]|uniref:Restriction endonuclease n=1 Tax=Cytobacillus praedii TaxID=1742358 RepID=A0A4R1ANK1_9BACI|nr:restriction endonuclease [Cytobacillus praedii]TCJ01249.1 restriction endonuclease [Cytobacillus praedii]